jgi:acetyl-CoA carboxylase beta subunit
MLTFRIHPIITMILVIAGILASARLAPIVLAASGGARMADARAGMLVLAAIVSFATAHGFMTGVVKDDLTLAAHATPLRSAMPSTSGSVVENIR